MNQDFIFEPTEDGKEVTVYFRPVERDLLFRAATHLHGLLAGDDETGDTTRLFPPAYGEDWARQVEFDRLAKAQLSESHVAAIEAMIALLDAERADEENVETFLRATNQLRLVLSKPLELQDGYTDADFPPDHPLYDTYQVFQYIGGLQYQAMTALQLMAELQGRAEPEDDFEPWEAFMEAIDLGNDDNPPGDPSNN